jgi:UDPglucose 6-dehydrogenase
MSVLGSNFLASVAEEVGANWSEIKNALRLDARIGKSAYLDPGLGITGGNLPRDLATLRSIAIKMSRTNQKFLNSIMNFNENQILWLIECIEYTSLCKKVQFYWLTRTFIQGGNFKYIEFSFNQTCSDLFEKSFFGI